MQAVHTLQEVDKILAETFMPPVSMREKYSLDDMHNLMEAIGSPQNNLKIVHVAGTSGKTSTCYYTSALLKAAGKKVGLTVSPHIDAINERVQIDLLPLPEAKFCKYFNEFLAIPAVTELKPSYFEVVVAFAFWVFEKEKVDYAVVEVGLGGLGDATNVIDRTDKVCVITDIGYDHTQVLGETIAKIARQKAGIIQEGNQAFMMEQSSEVTDIVRSAAAAKHGKLEIVQPQKLGYLQKLPPFMQRNWQLAYATTDFIIKRDNLQPLSIPKLTEAAHIVVPARMEIIEYRGKTIVLDGSHNQQKLTALQAGLQQKFKNKDIAFLMAFKHNREYLAEDSLEAIKPSIHSLVVTSFMTKQDYKHQSLDTKTVADAAHKIGIQQVRAIDDPREAFTMVLERPEPIVVVTGSFYLLNHIRPIIKQ